MYILSTLKLQCQSLSLSLHLQSEMQSFECCIDEVNEQTMGHFNFWLSLSCSLHETLSWTTVRT